MASYNDEYAKQANDKHQRQCRLGLAGIVAATLVLVYLITAVWANCYDAHRHFKPSLDTSLRVSCQASHGEWVSHHDGTPYCTWPK